MINSLHISNFKCIRDHTFALGRLNVLCGGNGVGKSTVVQSLLLLRQACQQSTGGLIVPLNGPFGLELGQALDVFHHRNDGDAITVSVSDIASGLSTWTFPVSQDSADLPYLTAVSRPANPPDPLRSEQTCAFTYLSAERLGPRDTLGIQSLPKDRLQIGVRGEFVGEVLKARELDTVAEAVLHPLTRGDTDKNRRLGHQTELWMREVIPNIEIRAESYPATNVTTLRFKNRRFWAEWDRPANMGFGISYSLPIVVAGLLAPADGLLIVDSPESHLHPAAQSRLAGFLAKVAAGGAQVIVETYSDHILNGIRLAAARTAGITASDVAIHSMQEDGDTVTVTEVRITESGQLSRWPVGFFDQAEQDLASIIRERQANVPK